MKMKKNLPRRQCDYPECSCHDEQVKRIDIPTNNFRGDDVTLNACKEHRKSEHHLALLKTDKSRKQML